MAVEAPRSTPDINRTLPPRLIPKFERIMSLIDQQNWRRREKSIYTKSRMSDANARRWMFNADYRNKMSQPPLQELKQKRSDGLKRKYREDKAFRELKEEQNRRKSADPEIRKRISKKLQGHKFFGNQHTRLKSERQLAS